jgi:hypothetical protein
MSKTRDVPLRLNLRATEEEIKKRQEEEQENALNEIRSTFFHGGKDPRLDSEQSLAPPSFEAIQNLKDNIENLYLRLRWKIKRSDIERGEIVGFNVYKKIYSRDEILREEEFRGRRIQDFDERAFDRLSNQIKKTGKFSSSKKAFPFLRKSSIPQSILNNNLRDANLRTSEAREGIVSQTLQSPGLFFSVGFVKIAYIDYSSFLSKERRKKVFVRDRRDAILFFDDKNIGHSEAYEYFITSISKSDDESPRSNSIKIKIDDFDPVKPPTRLIAKQINSNSISVSISVDSKENIGKILVYRKSDEEIEFNPIVEIPNIDDRINFIDNSVAYGKTYTYRIFLETIFGQLSEPTEITVFSSVQRITPQSKSNNLKVPLISAIQDQNSDFIKITISPNDPLVAYYELQRRDMTIKERKFRVPSKAETNYGGDGWSTNKFFVTKIRNPIEEDNKESVLTKRVVGEEIILIDETVQPLHIYQYRVRGYDLFQNPTSYNFVLVKAQVKKSFRAPINIQARILRGSPFRIKLTWTEDNETSLTSNEELFRQSEEPIESIKVLYKIQRRKFGSNVYETFPSTSNKFFVDEVATHDAVDFNGRKIPDTFEESEDIEVEPDRAIKFNKNNLVRPFGIPDFLKDNETYFYRLSVIAPSGEESNFTEEFEISTLADLSDPINFSSIIINSKIEPIIGILTWEIDKTKARPDHWIIERKIDDVKESFEEIGKAYLNTDFIDRSLILGNSYLYRIKSIDLIGRESEFFETRLTL